MLSSTRAASPTKMPWRPQQGTQVARYPHGGQAVRPALRPSVPLGPGGHQFHQPFLAQVVAA